MSILLSSIISDLPFSVREAQQLLISAPARYKVHEIKKRNGRGVRTIAQPTAEIKLLQRWAINLYAPLFPIHTAATAYIAGGSIKNHAEPHAKNRYLLKLDFEDFFPSITGNDIENLLQRYIPLPQEDIRLLTRLLCWRGKPAGHLRLSIGAPSSPFISNAIMFEIDSKIEEHCQLNSATYTRYADDIAISTQTPHSLQRTHQFISDLLKETRSPKLLLNQSKTVFTSKKNHRKLTGLTLSNDGEASLGRERKRQIRAMAHAFCCGKLTEQEILKLRGWLAFSRSIDSQFISSLKRMMGEEKFKSITNT